MSPTGLPAPSATAVMSEFWAERRSVAGTELVVTTVDEAAETICRAAERLGPTGGRRGEHVHLASAQTVALAATDPVVDAVVNTDGWTLPDGKPLAWLSRLRGDAPALHQTRGFDVFEAVCRRGLQQGLRHYLLGSTPATLAAMERTLRQRYPGIRVVGTHSPPFRPATDDELEARDAAVAASGAQIVWVGLGTPKQDHEVARLAGRLPVVAVAVGAVFDFSAGTLRLAPAWMSALGLEWLFRLLSEPKRLWRRYTIDSGRFLLAAAHWGRRRRLTRR